MKHYQLFKLRAVLLLFALLCSMPSVWATPAYISGDSGPMWEYNAGTKTLTISGEGEVTKPSDLPWVNYDVEHIVIESGITSIGSMLFNGLTGLKSVTMANTVTKIGSYAFERCETLVTVSFSDNIEEIEEYAFNECYGITTITLPSMLTTIGNAAFSSCYQLTNLAIPDNVTSIGASAFYNCGITTINIPASVNDIGLNPFSSCKNLVDITVASTNTKYDSRNDCKAIIETSSNKLISGCKSTTIPEGVETIDANAFLRITGLTSITIPDGVRSIGNNAFNYCSNLQSIALPNSVQNLGIGVFANCDNLSSVSLSTNLNNIENSLFWGCSSLVTLTIPASVTRFEDLAFLFCRSMTDVYCPLDPNDANTTIVLDDVHSDTFKENKGTYFHVFNKSIWETKFPNANVTFMGDLGKQYISGDSGPMWEYNGISKELTISGEGEMPSFESTDSPWKDVNIETITIEEGVTCIGDYAFKNTSVEAVTISSTVATIGAHAFESCTSLASINIPEGVATTREYAFKDCSSLETVTLPNSLTSIETGAFVGCVATEDVYCYANPANLTWTDNNTCFKPSKATYFHVNNSNAWISAYPDANITYVQDVANDWTSKQYISGTSGPMWRYSATLNTLEISGTGDIPDFTSSTYPWDSYVNNIYSILIKDGVTSIGAKAFENCYYTKSFIIGNDVTSIGEYSIPESEITSIYIPQNVSNISINAFCNIYYLSTITVDSRNTYYDSRNDCNAIITKDNVLFLGSKNTIIPEDVVAIGDYAFYGSSIERCVIPNNVTTIGENAFAWSKLKSIVINGVETIKQYAFSYPEHLSVITLPSSLTKIENHAFEGCYAATEIYCYANPNNLTWEGYNGNYCFKKLNYDNTPNFHVADASAWQSKFSGANTNWIGDLEGEWTTYKYISGESGAMWQYNPILKTLRIGGTGDMPELGEYSTPWLSLRVAIDNAIINDGVTSIGKNSFFRCESLNSIIIPSSVINIGESAFSGCISLASATLYSPSLPTYATNVFKNNAANRKIYVLSDCVNTYQMGWSSYVGDILPISLGMNANPQKTADKWCTYYNSSTNVTVPSGTTIYKAQLDQVNNKVVLTEVEGSVVAKGNAVMLKSSDANIALSSATTSDLGTYSDNDLKGGDVTSGYIAYTLAGINGIMGFYRFTGNSLDPNKAHLEVANSNPNSAPQLIPFDNGTTEIMLNTVKTAEDKGEWYSLDGRLIQGKPTQKGIYVKKGKKYVVK